MIQQLDRMTAERFCDTVPPPPPDADADPDNYRMLVSRESELTVFLSRWILPNFEMALVRVDAPFRAPLRVCIPCCCTEGSRGCRLTIDLEKCNG